MINVFSRDIDLLAMLHHPWTYLPLLDDVIGIDDSSSRTITVPVEESKERTYNIDYTDHVLLEHGLKPIPEVGETIDAQLAEWTAKYEDMNRQASSNNVEDISTNLQQAIDQLPKIKSEKELIESHTNICTALFDKIKSRKIDEYTTVESDLMTQGYVTGAEKATFEKLLSDTENASVESAVDKA